MRFHGIFNDDVGVYSEDASGAPIYDWSRVDAIYDAIVAAGMRPFVEVSFTPTALASDAEQDPDAALVQQQVSQHQPAHRRRTATGASGPR